MILFRPAQVVTGSGSQGALHGKDMQHLVVMTEKSVAITEGKIGGILDNGEAKRRISAGEESLDCAGMTVMPGFVDSHTHILYAGERRDEFIQRLGGAGYSEILASGNGILKTVRETRAASENDIFRETLKRIRSAILNGTTTMEIKTGYCLDNPGEEKLVNVLKRMSDSLPISLVGTFLGAHAIPPGTTEDRYVDSIISEMIPNLPEWIRYVDVFCDSGAFGVDSTRRMLDAAVQSGKKLRLHSDELACIGCSQLAEEFPVVSVDHLIRANNASLQSLEKSGSIATLLPTTAYSLSRDSMPDGRKFMERGIPVAIATDSSPNVPGTDLLESLFLACTECHMTVEQAVNAMTVNAAHSIDLGDSKGTIAPGYDADLCVLDIGDYRDLVYMHGNRIVRNVFARGSMVVENFSPSRADQD